MVKVITENKKLQVLNEDKEIYVMKAIRFVPKNKNKTDLKMSDIKQGHIQNCTVTAAIASLIQRPEFVDKIYPHVVRTNKRIKLQCKMFCNGDPVLLMMKNTLPFFKDHPDLLLYARSNRHNNVYLASVLEKAFVILACNYSYGCSEYADPVFVFSAFSDSMIGERRWSNEKSKQDLMEYIKDEFDNKSSVVFSVTPSFDLEPDNEDPRGHCYALKDYSDGFVKIYEPNCAPALCKSDRKLPRLLEADAHQGEFWVAAEDFQNREVDVTSLYSKSLYKYVFKINRQSKHPNNEEIISKAAFTVKVKETSRFMINFFSSIFEYAHLEFAVTIAEPYNQMFELQLETNLASCNIRHLNKKINERQIWIKKFTLEPNTYNFRVHRKVVTDNLTPEEKSFLASQDKELYHFRIASTSEFEFKEISYEGATSFTQEIEQKFDEMSLSKVGDDGNSNVNI